MAENRYLDELFGTARSNDTCLCMTPNLYMFDFNKEYPLMVIPDTLRLRLTIINKGEIGRASCRERV